MNAAFEDPVVRTRAIAAGILSAVAILLIAGLFLIPGSRGGPGVTAVPDVQVSIGRAVDTLLVRYGIDRRDVKTWRVTSAGHFSRIEQRAFVPPHFGSLEFNHDLSRLVSSIGARVVGTERAKENSVTMHIVYLGTTIRSIAFITRNTKDR